MSAKLHNKCTSGICISKQYLNHPNLLLRSVYKFHLYFYVRIIMHHLGSLLSDEDSFSDVKRSCY